MSHQPEPSFASAIPEWLNGGGEMGALMRGKDWERTPLGPPDSWSPSLKMMTRFLLANRFPLLLWWGPQFCQLYNDAYRPILGTKHPHFLGQPVSECWSEIWHILRPLIETPFNGGPATWMEDILLEINRYGFLEESHFTIAYSPVPDETVASGIGGVLATVHEISEKVVGERRVVVLRDLGTRAVEAKTAEEACVVAAETFSKHSKDVPFALLYLIDSDERRARLACAAGMIEGGPASPLAIEIDEDHRDQQVWPLAEVIETQAMQTVEDLAGRFGDAVPQGPWSDPPRQAVVTPIRSSIAHHLAGLLVVGISSRLRLDDSYRSFIELAAGQIATAVANARAYEEERKRAEALAEIDRAKTTFFSNVSHEFRTPLTLILGPLEDALAEDGLPAAAQEPLRVAHRNSQRLLKLVNTLLDFSRIEAGRIEAVYEPVDLAALTADLASVFRSAVEKAGMRLVVDCPDLPTAVYVDREMWEKIVLNLLSNAFKFTFDGAIKVTLRPAGEMVELAVSDTGTGIPAEELPHLFERFHRVKGARRRSYEGSGIGLALVLELVKLHGGSVRVTSEIDRGSTFTISIPTGKSHLPADRIGAARTLASTGLHGEVYVEEALRWLPGEDLRSPDLIRRDLAAQLLVETGAAIPSRILLADDNADMREYVRRLLAQRGYEVVAVADGEAARSAAREQSFNLILTDVMMPKLDGFGLLKTLREDERTRATPIIMLSARAGEESRVEGIEAGADDYLVKPFSARELVARVESNLKLARLRHEEDTRTVADLQAMERLLEIGNLCARAGYDFEQCLEKIVTTAVALTGADKGNIQLLDAESGVLKIAAHYGFEEPFLEFFAGVGDQGAAACGAALRAAERIIVEDVTESEIFAGQASLEALLDADIRAVQSTPLISTSGQVLGIISTHFRRPHRPSERDLRLIDLLVRQTADYLERRSAEEALHARDAQLQTLFAVAPIGVYLVDADFRIRQANPTALPVFGDIPDLIGRDFDEVIHILWMKEYADEIVRLFRHTLETGEPYIGPERSEERRDRGVIEYYEWQINRIPLSDGRYGVVCYFRDVSAQVKARKAVEEANRLKDEFLATLSHELRNPLNSITGYADVLLRNHEAKRLSIVRQAAGTIQRNAEAQAQLINDLLDLSRLQTGKLAVDQQPMAVAPVVGDAVESVRAQAAAKELKLDVDFPARMLVVNADPVRVQQVVWNLVNNAIKFTPKGGRVVVSLFQEGEAAKLVVEDTGEGIEPAFLPHVFEMFRQAEGGIKRVHGGMGIGLALVKQLVELHGGEVEAFSEGQGRGARFTVKFPLYTGAGPEQTLSARTVEDELSGARILVVDDSQDSLEMLRLLLSGEGAAVQTASNGEEGLRLAMNAEFDLIISDISMPVMDGYEFLRNLQEAQSRYANVPAIALTGFGREDDVERAREVGFTTHLTKPLDFDQLLRLARVALRK